MKKLVYVVLCLALIFALAACAEHEHTYNTEQWASNAYGHWHVANCEHTDEVADVAAHTDANNDGTCDICAYNGGHEHGYQDSWDSDATDHWHSSECGHAVVADKAAHTYNEVGVCTVCGYEVGVSPETVAEAIELGVKQAGAVKDGMITINSENAYASNKETIKYQISTGKFYANILSDSGMMDGGYGDMVWVNEKTEQWIGLKEDGSVYGYTYVDGVLQAMQQYDETNGVGIDTDSVKGYTFESVIGYGDRYIGVDGLVSGLYELGAEYSNNNDIATEVVDGVYSFEYSFVFEGEYSLNYYTVAVSFELADDYYIDNVAVTINLYSEGDMVGCPEMPSNLTEEEQTAWEYEYYTLTEGAEPTTVAVFAIDQNNEMDLTYTPEVVEVSEFSLADANGDAIESNLNVILGVNKYFTIEVNAPETAVLALSDVVIKLDGEVVDYTNANVYSSVVEEYTNEKFEYVSEPALLVRGKVAGTYQLEVQIGSAVNTYTLTVATAVDATPVAIPAVVAGEWEGEGGFFDYNFYEYVTVYGTITLNEDGTGVFSASNDYMTLATANIVVSNVEDGAESSKIITVEKVSGPDNDYPEDLYVGQVVYNGTSIFVDFAVNNLGSFEGVEFTKATAGGDEGGDEGGSTVPATELAIGNNAINAANVTFEYTASENGTLTLTAGGAIMGMVEISYTVNNGTSNVFELSTTVELTLEAGDVVTITVVAEGYSTITAAWEGSSVGGGEGSEGDEEGTLSFELEDNNNGTYSGTYTYVIGDNDVVTVYDEEGTDVSSTIIFSKDMGGFWTVQVPGMNMAVNLTDEDNASVTELAGTLNVDYVMSGLYVFTFASAEGGSTVPATELVIGNNQIEATNVTFEYTASENGTLTLTAGAAIMGMVEISYTVNNGTSNVFELSTTVELALEAGDVVTIAVVAEGYSSITAAWEA